MKDDRTQPKVRVQNCALQTSTSSSWGAAREAGGGPPAEEAEPRFPGGGGEQGRGGEVGS